MTSLRFSISLVLTMALIATTLKLKNQQPMKQALDKLKGVLGGY